MNAIHRDLKAGNIFLSLDGQVVLGDFGVAAQLIEGGEAATGKRTFAGTPCWMAPEVMMQQGSYASPADMWSFGITAIELAKGRAPHADLHAMKVVMKVMSSQPPSLDEGEDKNRFSKPFRAMVKRCLVKVSFFYLLCLLLFIHTINRQGADGASNSSRAAKGSVFQKGQGRGVFEAAFAGSPSSDLGAKSAEKRGGRCYRSSRGQNGPIWSSGGNGG